MDGAYLEPRSFDRIHGLAHGTSVLAMVGSIQMNYRFIIVVIYCAILLATMIRLAKGQSPTPFDASTIDYSKFTPEEIAATEAHRDALKSQVKTDLSTVVVTSDAQAASLQKATHSLDLYDAAVKARIDQGNAAIASLAKLVKKHHLDLIILIGLWVCLCGAVYLKAGMEMGAAGVWIAGIAVAAGTVFILWRL